MENGGTAGFHGSFAITSIKTWFAFSQNYFLLLNVDFRGRFTLLSGLLNYLMLFLPLGLVYSLMP